jgi:hypothetical protein
MGKWHNIIAKRCEQLPEQERNYQRQLWSDTVVVKLSFFDRKPSQKLPAPVMLASNRTIVLKADGCEWHLAQV